MWGGPPIAALCGVAMAIGILVGAATAHRNPPPPPQPTVPTVPVIHEFDYHLRDGRVMTCLQTPSALDCDWWNARPIPPAPPLPIPPLPEQTP